MKIRNRKRLSAFFALGLIVLLVIAACGEEATPTPVPATPTTPAEPTATPEPTATLAPGETPEPTATTAPTVAVPTPTPTTAPVVGEQPLSGGTLRTFGFDPPTFDTTRTTSFAPAEILSFTHIRLTRWDFSDPLALNFTPNPDLAESWDVSEDGLTITFHLRQGVLWQNIFPVSGREVVADDVVFSYNRYLEPESPQRQTLGPITNISAPDKYTVVFEFEEPYAPFMTQTGSPYFPIHAPEVLEEFGDFSTAESVIGAGPWILENFERGVGYNFVKNPDYYRGENGITGESLPYIERIEAVTVPDRDARTAMYRAGDNDDPGSCGCLGLWNVYVSEVDFLTENNPELLGDFRAFSSGAYNLYWFAPNTTTFPFMSQKVRQAVSVVIDRGDAWAVSVAGPTVDTRELASTHPNFVPLEELGEGALYYPVDEEGNYIRDPEFGLELMNEGLQQLIDDGIAPAGFEIGDRIDIDLHTTASYDEFIIAGAELIASWLGDIHFDITIKTKEYGDFISTTFIGDYEGIGFGYESTFVDADEMWYGLFFPGAPKNRAKSDDPEMNALILAQRSTLDSVARGEIEKELQKLNAVKQYNWFFPNYTTYNAYPDYIKNVGPQLQYDAGNIWLEAWLTEDAPGRQ